MIHSDDVQCAKKFSFNASHPTAFPILDVGQFALELIDGSGTACPLVQNLTTECADGYVQRGSVRDALHGLMTTAIPCMRLGRFASRKKQA